MGPKVVKKIEQETDKDLTAVFASLQKMFAGILSQFKNLAEEDVSATSTTTSTNPKVVKKIEQETDKDLTAVFASIRKMFEGIMSQFKDVKLAEEDKKESVSATSTTTSTNPKVVKKIEEETDKDLTAVFASIRKMFEGIMSQF